ncbi:hypothetical protein ACSBR2_001342 [Camellia fascicularis]
MRCVNYRSNMTGLVKLMKGTKFTDTQLSYLRQIPFWQLLNALRTGEIDLDKCMNYDDVVVHILQTYKASKDTIYVGKKKMNIHDNDIKLIFGVDCGTKPMDISYEPQCDEPPTTSPELDNIKKEQHGGNSSEFFGKGVYLNDSDNDINIPFSSLLGKRAIVVASTSQLDIIEMLVKENWKALGIIRQWEAKYKHLEFSWELKARVITDLEDKLFNQSSPPNMNTEIKKCMDQKDAKIRRLTQLVIDLECEKTVHQHLFDDKSVHIVTQVEAQKHHDSLNKQPPTPMQHNLSPPSRVKRIEEKDQKKHCLPDFQYPDLLGQKKEHD